jgi:AAA domain
MHTYPLADIESMLTDVPDPKEQANGTRRPSVERPNAGRKPRAREDMRALQHLETLAMQRAQDWVPNAFPGAIFQEGTGGWRVPASKAGQPQFEEDLSFHAEGIFDFGSEQGFTPIGALMHFCTLNPSDVIELNERDPDGNPIKAMTGRQASRWLADQLCFDLTKALNDEIERDFGDEVPAGMCDLASTRARGVISATPFVLPDPATIKPREWLYASHYARGYVGVTVAPGGVGKSSLALVEAVAMATGKDLLGDRPRGPLKVWAVNGEDPYEEIERRIAAICLHYGITAEDIGNRLHVSSGRDADFTIACESQRETTVIEPTVAALRKNIREKAIDVLIVDPFVSMHGVPENDNRQINLVIRQFSMIAEEAGCAVEIVHHTRKALANAQGERTADDARGAGALINGARSVRVLNAMSDKEGKDAGIAERWSIFRVDSGKANLAPPPEKSVWRRKISVPLGNERPGLAGDKVGVVVAWPWPDLIGEISPVQISKIRDKVAAGEWREDSQAKNWVGNVIAEILGVDLNDKPGRYGTKMIVRNLLNDGILMVVRRKDEQRKEKGFVEIGNERRAP